MIGMMIATIDGPGAPCDDDLHDDDDEDDDDDARLGFFSSCLRLSFSVVVSLSPFLSVSRYDNSEIRGTKSLIFFI